VLKELTVAGALILAITTGAPAEMQRGRNSLGQTTLGQCEGGVDAAISLAKIAPEKLQKASATRYRWYTFHAKEKLALADGLTQATSPAQILDVVDTARVNALAAGPRDAGTFAAMVLCSPVKLEDAQQYGVWLRMVIEYALDAEAQARKRGAFTSD